MTNLPPDQDPDQDRERERETKEVKKNPLSDKLDSIRKNEKIEGIYNYAASNMRDTLSYILMVIGIVLLFSYPFYGGLIVGIIFGLYFIKEVTLTLSSLNEIIEQQGMVRSLIFGGLLLALLVVAWPIYIGIAVAVAVHHILYPESTSKQ